jgi:hypothetical protein
MNILYILQQSIYNNEGKWISSDSNINMMGGILRELLEKTDWHFYILIAPLNDFADIKSYDELLDSNERIHWVPYNFIVDAFFNRQHFNIGDFDSMFKPLPKIDVVWNNITELSRNIKTYLWYKSKETKLISCCYWLDAPEIGEEKIDKNISYDWRQFDGFECSDLAVFTCKSTKKAFIQNARKKFNGKYTSAIKNKSTIWDFGFSTKEADKYKTDEKFDKPTILFLNRLSGINYTHHEEFIQAINLLAEKRNDFQVIFTNPSGKYSSEWLKENVKNVLIYKDHPLNRQEYFELLWKAEVSVHLYNIERYGGCANLESIYCENTIIMPKVFEYAKRGGSKYEYYCDIPIAPESICEKLNLALDNMSDSSIKMKKFVKKESSFESISDNVIKDIKGLFSYDK